MKNSKLFESRESPPFEAVAKLRALLEADIVRLDKESCRHKRIHRRAEVVLTVLAAATTIVAGLGLVLPGRERGIQFAILALSAFTAGITAWSESRRARDLWQHEREVYYALKDILRELDFRSSLKPLKLEEVEEIFRRVNSILGSSTAKWSQILERKLKNPQGEGPTSPRLPR